MPTSLLARRALLPALALVALASLSCSDSTGPAAGPASLAIAQGDAQPGVVGDTLAAPLAVRVLDGGGHPVRGVPVRFEVASGNGRVTAALDTSDAGGVASTYWVLGTSVRDSQVVQAVVQLAGTSLAPVRFHAHATADSPSLLVKVAGDSQAGVVQATLGVPVQVRLVDRYGNPTPSRGVIFTIDTADGWPVGASYIQATRPTDSTGLAAAPWTLGPRARTQTLRVASASLPGQEIRFTAQARAGAAARMLIAPEPFNAIVNGMPGGGPVSMLLVDSAGNRAAQVGVQVSVSATTGVTVSGTTTVATDSTGRATFDAFIVSGRAGLTKLVFTAPGIVPTEMPLVLEAGTPAALLKIAGDSQAGTVGTALPLPLTVRVVDAWGNGVRDALVSFWDYTSSVSPSATTDSAGYARLSVTLDTVARTKTYFAATYYGGTEIGRVPMVVIGRPDAPTRLTVVDSAFAFADSTALGARPRVRVLDRYGNAIAGAAVTFAPAAGSGTIDSALAHTDSSGWARSGTWTPSGTADTSFATATVNGTALVAHFSARRLQPLLVRQVSVGYLDACALTTTGETWCWGNPFGSLRGSSFGVGDGTTGARLVPVRVATGVQFASVAVGISHACGLDASGAAWCWGDNSNGQLGDGTTTGRTVPTAVQSSVRFKSLALGALHSCGIAIDDRAYCWGYDQFGTVGDSTIGTGNRLAPTAVAGGHQFRSLAAADYATCGVTPDDKAYCWGYARWYQIPIDSLDPNCLNTTWKCYRAPRLVADSGVADVDMGYEYGCLRAHAGTLSCWGLIPGSNANSERYGPVPAAAGFAFAQMALSLTNICGLDASGAAYCNGDDYYSGTGVRTGSYFDIVTPTAVLGGHAYSAIDAGTWSTMTCAIEASTGKLYCWGQGNLGNGASNGQVDTPIVVGH